MEGVSIERIADLFGINVAEGRVAFTDGKDKFVSGVDLPVDAEAYIVHTPSSVKIASMPELVGKALDNLAISSARFTASFLKKLLNAEESLVFLHILRGSQGYRLDVALREAGFDVREQFVRVVYNGGTGEKHLEAAPHVGKVQFSELSGSEKTLVVADTVATGRTLLEALRLTLDMAGFKGMEFRRIVIYGFISEPGARKASEFISERGAEPVLITLEDFAALASNQYDMPLYGPDTTPTGVNVDRLISGTTVPEALENMIRSYFPGMDQPGDWSERQCLLFTGSTYERGRIDLHLENSLKALEALREAIRGAEWYEEWMDKIYAERRARLEEAKGKNHCAYVF